MKNTLKAIMKAALVLASAFALFLAVLGFMKIGILYWCYSRIFAFASGMPGLDYYTAVFISTGLTAMLAMALPSFLGSFLTGIEPGVREGRGYKLV